MFAVSLNNQVWDLWEKKDRSADDDELMTHAAHASLYHWLQVGKKVNHQRGEWMIAKCYMLRGLKTEAMRHAKRCLDITQQFPAENQDFDVAFAYELMARVSALVGDRAETAKYLAQAEAAGNAIAKPGDRTVFEQQFNAEPWYGAR